MNIVIDSPEKQIADTMHRLYKKGLTTSSGGNISIKGDDGSIYITPSGKDKGVLKPEDIVRVYPDGTVEGNKIPSIEVNVHASIYKARPDLKAVLHAHSADLVAFSLTNELPDLDLLPQTKKICNNIVMAPPAVPGSEELITGIRDAFATGSNLVMAQNHGAFSGAVTLDDAFIAFEMLNFCAKLQILAKRLSNIVLRSTEARCEEMYAEKIAKLDEYENSVSVEEQAARTNLHNFIRRAYDTGIITSGQGSFSCRLSDGSFLITPHGLDKGKLNEQDLIRIYDGKTEKGTTPSIAWKLHELIYQNNPDVGSVILAQPPHAMTFAVTDVPFNTRLTPETYLVLHDVYKYPFGFTFNQPDMLAKELSLDNPMVIVENDCIVVCGQNVQKAFDKLEVFEFTASSVINAGMIGYLNPPLTDEQAEAILKLG